MGMRCLASCSASPAYPRLYRRGKWIDVEDLEAWRRPCRTDRADLARRIGRTGRLMVDCDGRGCTGIAPKLHNQACLSEELLQRGLAG
jgi:hypothetical protein